MKIVVIALLESFMGIANVCAFILLCWVMLSILGMNFVAGKLAMCNMPSGASSWGISKTQCINIYKGTF